MTYFELDISLEKPKEFCDIIIAFLNEINFESYELKERGVKAYIQDQNFSQDDFDEFIKKMSTITNLDYDLSEIPDVNWNKEWEKNFSPVYINKECVVRADFHKKIDNTSYEIILSPKMSFGTGHHPTTYLMMNEMFRLDFKKKSVFDMGYGTGILSILSAKFGAKNVSGSDISNYAYQNAYENAKLNDIDSIDFQKGGLENLEKNKYDIILANINKNILLEHLLSYKIALRDTGLILLSGFLDEDKEVILKASEENELTLKSSRNMNKWQLLCLEK